MPKWQHTLAVDEDKSQPMPAIEHPPGLAWRHLLKSNEGRVLLVGVALAFAGLAAMGVVAYWSPQTSRMIGAMSISNIIFGRAVSMSIGYAGGYGHSLVIPVNLWVETVLVLLFYPVFVLSMRKLVLFPRLKRILDYTHEAAVHHHDKVRRFGIVGLFVFVCFPFWMTGPVIGCAIGYLLDFPIWLTLSVVLAGTYIAIMGWAYLLFELYIRTVAFGPWAPVLIIGLIIVMVIAGYRLNRRGKNRNPKVSA